MTSPQKVLPFSEPLLFSCPVIVVHLNCWPHSYDCRRYRSAGLYQNSCRDTDEMNAESGKSSQSVSKNCEWMSLETETVFQWQHENQRLDEGRRLYHVHTPVFYVRLFFSLFLALHQSIAFFLSGHRSISLQTWIWTLITVAMLDISKLSGQSDWQPNWNTDI